MTLEEVRIVLNAEPIWEVNLSTYEVNMGCGCDLMSDVLAFIKPGSLLLTGLTNSQVVYTAEIADIKAVVFVRGKRPDEETIELAKSRSLPLLVTKLPMFESCGLLYRAGLAGCSEYEKDQ